MQARVVFLLSILAATAAGAPAGAQTLERIQRTNTLSIGYVPGQAPFSYRTTESQPAGYAVELCAHVAREIESGLGLTKMAVVPHAATAQAAIEHLEAGRIDLFCGLLPETERTRQRVSFSIPIYVTGIGALVRKDAPPALLRVLNGEVPHTGPTWRATVNAGLANYVYAVHAGTTSEKFVRERIAASGVIARVISVPTYEAGIKMLERNEVHAFFADRAALHTQLSRRANPGQLLLIDRRFTLEPVALALARGDENFRLAVDRALSRLYRSGDVFPTYTRYFGPPTETARLLFLAHALP